MIRVIQKNITCRSKELLTVSFAKQEADMGNLGIPTWENMERRNYSTILKYYWSFPPQKKKKKKRLE